MGCFDILLTVGGFIIGMAIGGGILYLVVHKNRKYGHTVWEANGGEELEEDIHKD